MLVEFSFLVGFRCFTLLLQLLLTFIFAEMFDDTSDLELLHDDLHLSDDENLKDVLPSKRKKQVRDEYKLDRVFETTEAFDGWWASDGAIGWKFINLYTSKRSGI